MKKKSLILTALAVLLLIWALICAAVEGNVPVDVVLMRLSPYILAFIVTGIFFTLNRKVSVTVLFLIICLWGLYECGLGVSQLAGWTSSKHNLFKLTGSFGNPGPYGGLLAMVSTCCLAVLLKKEFPKWLKIISAVTLLFSLIMLGFSGSRSSWMGTIIAVAVILAKETSVYSRIRHKALFWSISAIIGVAAVIGAYSLKPESAQCRLFLWHMDSIAIVEHPVFGNGPGAEMAAYGQAQHDFFANDVRSERLIKIADCPQFAFNEFLRFGMACGILGLILSIAIYALALTLMLRRRSIFTGPWIALGIFALFSFPLSRIFMSVLAAMLLATACAEKDKEPESVPLWAAAFLSIAVLGWPCVKVAQAQVHRRELLKTAENADLMIEKAEKILDRSLQYDPGTMFYYGRALYGAERLDDAVNALTSASKVSPDPMIWGVKGECERYLGKFRQAEEDFKYAHYMVPVRLFPMLFLCRLYYALGDEEGAHATRDYAFSLPIDLTLPNTAKIHQQILDLEN